LDEAIRPLKIIVAGHVAIARERRRAAALELDIAVDAVTIRNLSQQDGASVAELRHEVPELVPGVGQSNRRRMRRHQVASENCDALRRRQRVRVDEELPR
jgi:hypothetical protein